MQSDKKIQNLRIDFYHDTHQTAALADTIPHISDKRRHQTYVR
jgi:hypothetical protein